MTKKVLWYVCLGLFCCSALAYVVSGTTAVPVFHTEADKLKVEIRQIEELIAKDGAKPDLLLRLSQLEGQVVSPTAIGGEVTPLPEKREEETARVIVDDAPVGMTLEEELASIVDEPIERTTRVEPSDAAVSLTGVSPDFDLDEMERARIAAEEYELAKLEEIAASEKVETVETPAMETRTATPRESYRTYWTRIQDAEEQARRDAGRAADTEKNRRLAALDDADATETEVVEKVSPAEEQAKLVRAMDEIKSLYLLAEETDDAFAKSLADETAREVGLMEDSRPSRSRTLDEAGDSCTEPFQATDEFTVLSDSSCGRGDTKNPTCSSYGGGEDYIVEWTTTVDTCWTITFDPKGTTWSAVILIDTCEAATDSCIAEATSSGGTVASISQISLAAGTYYFVVDNWPSPTCIPDFDLTVVKDLCPVLGRCCYGDAYAPSCNDPELSTDCYARSDFLYFDADSNCIDHPCVSQCPEIEPVANECADAIPLTIPVTRGGTTVGATPNTLPTCGTGDGTGGAVWYTVVGTGNTITASLCDPCTEFDTRIRVYSCACDTPTCVVGDDDGCTAPGAASIVSWCSNLDETYWIVVHGYSTYEGRFVLDVSDDGTPCSPGIGGCPPVGRCCYGEELDPDCADELESECLARTNYLSWDADSNCTEHGCPLPPLGRCCYGDIWDPTCIDEYESICTALEDFLSWDADSNCTEHPCPTCPEVLPAGDECVDAVLLTAPTERGGTLQGASPISTDLPYCGTSASADRPAVWYRVVGTGNTLTASTCHDCWDNDPYMDTKMRVYTCSCTSPVCVGGNDDDYDCDGYTTFASTVSWCSVLDEDYFIVVYAFSADDTGRFVFTLTDDGTPCSEGIGGCPEGRCCYGDEFDPDCVDEMIRDDCLTLDGIWTEGAYCAANITEVDVGGLGLVFTPDTFTVWVGDTVRWVDTVTTVAHNVVEGLYPNPTPLFTSGAAAVGPWTFDWVPTVAGEYDYYCEPHAGSGMVGYIYVLDENSCPPPVIGRCCYGPDPFDPQCVDTTERACGDLDGDWDEFLDCTTACPVPAIGRCCYGPDEFAPQCWDTTEAYCLDSLDGDWDETLDCTTPCPTPEIARCCYFDSVAVEYACVDTHEAYCDTVLAGYWMTGLTCAECPCPDESRDSCHQAMLIPVPGTVFGSTIGATPDTIGYCGTSESTTSGAVWYKVTGNGNTYTVSTCSPCSDFDTQIQVWKCDCDSLVCVDGNDDDHSERFDCTIPPYGYNRNSSVTWCTRDGEDYLILVYGLGADGHFALSTYDDGPCTEFVTCLPLDPCPTVSCTPTVTETEPNNGCSVDSTMNTVACGDVVQGTIESNGVTRDVDCFEFEITGVDSQNVTLTLDCEFDGILLLSAADGQGSCNLTAVSGEVDLAGRCDSETYTAICIDPGWYQVFVTVTFDYPDSGGYCLDIECGPCVYPVGRCCYFDSVGMEDACVDTTELACDTTFYGYWREGLTCAGDPCPVSEDSCHEAIEITTVPADIEGTTIGSTTDSGTPMCGTTSISSPGVWYWVAGTGNTMTASIYAADQYVCKLTVLCNECDDLICIDGNQDLCDSPYTDPSVVTWCSELGRTYYILVHGYAGYVGMFNLSVTDDATPCFDPPVCWPDTGRCCYGDPVSPTCVDTTEAACDDLGGRWDADSTCANPCPPCIVDFTVTTFPYTNTTTLCGAGDDCDLRTGEEHIYQVVIPHEGRWSFSLCGTDPAWDTYMYLGAACCGATITTDDDGCPEFGPSEIDCYTLTAGTYYVDVEPFSSTNCDVYTIDIFECVRCTVECAVTDVHELPESDTLGFVDPNGGCGADPPTENFLNIVCDDTVCGIGYTWAEGTTGYRDTDWMLFTIVDSTDVSWTVTAEFDELLIGIVYDVIDNDLSTCDSAAFVASQTTDIGCDTISVSITCLPPGTYACFVAPNVFGSTTENPYPIGLAYEWRGWFECGPCIPPVGQCCYGPDPLNPDCDVTTDAECVLLGGIFTPGLDCTTPCPIVVPLCEITYSNCGDDDGDDYISRVNFNNGAIDNSTGRSENCPDSYGNYTNMQANVTPGETYPISIEVMTPDDYTYSECVNVWIDWNHNYTWDLATELLELGCLTPPSITQPAVYNGNITVPLDAITGTTFMRVVEQYSSAEEDGCNTDNDSFGEAEDYVLIVGEVECDPVTDLTVYLNATLDSVVLRWTAPQDADYRIWSTTKPNNDGDPDGGSDTDFTQIGGPTAGTTSLAMSHTEWVPDTINSATYLNFVVTTENCGPPPPTGRCCYNNDANCVDTTEAACATLPDSYWDSGMTCLANPCGVIEYCEICFTDFDDEWIDSVAFAGITNGPTGPEGEPCSYGSYLGLTPASIQRGQSYQLDVQAVSSGTYTECVAVYFDWNQDGDFADGDERYDVGVCTATPYLATASILVPATADLGTTTMRVVLRWLSASTDPCETYLYGEAEDYTVDVHD